MEKKKYIYRRDKEGDPAHHDKHGGGEVDGEDEGAQRPAQQNLKPVRTVVACISLDISTPSIKTPSQPTWTSNKNSLMWRQILDVHIEGQGTLIFPGFQILIWKVHKYLQMPTCGSCSAHSGSCVLNHTQLEENIIKIEMIYIHQSWDWG